MTGRGIDQILPYPSPPILYEGYADSALDYVAMAETWNGGIPRPTGFSYVWGDALTELERAAPAARIINLETSITTSDIHTPKGINYRMHPANTPCLNAAKIDCCVLANNHVLDWGRPGLQETLNTLSKAGIAIAGAGLNLAEAGRPCSIQLEAATGGTEPTLPARLLIFAVATSDSGVPPDWAATEAECGVLLLPDLSDTAADSLAARVGEARRPGDIAIVSAHWGGNWGYGISRNQRGFAHRLIDSGAVDLIHGHSSHHRKAIEVYRKKLILYGCGDFLNDYEGITGYEEFRTQLVQMYFATFHSATQDLASLDITPLELHRFRLRWPGKHDVRWLQEVLTREGRQFGTVAVPHGASRLRLEWT